MILSDKDIRRELEKGELTITPAIKEEQIQPASIDLTLSDSFNDEEYGDVTSDVIVIYPGEFILGSTMEKVKIPDYLVGRVEGRSSYGRLGLLVHVSAGFIDPGFEGRITLEFANLGNDAIRLRKGCRICQLVLEELCSPCERPYGSDGLGSKYQNQYLAEPSRIKEEVEENHV